MTRTVYKTIRSSNSRSVSPPGPYPVYGFTQDCKAAGSLYNWTGGILLEEFYWMSNSSGD